MSKLKKVGETEDGKDVVSGVFFLRDTEGFPLDIIALELKEHNMVMALDEYVRDARKAGWKDKRIKNDITALYPGNSEVAEKVVLLVGA